MWLVFGGAAVALILSLAVGKSIAQRHRKRQNRSMRDHLNRVSQRPDDV